MGPEPAKELCTTADETCKPVLFCVLHALWMRQSRRLRLLFGIESASKVIQRMIKTFQQSPGVKAPVQMDGRGRRGSQAQLHEDRDGTVRAGDGLKETLKETHAYNQ